MINKTFVERIQEATTWDRGLEQEIYLQLYREDLLSNQGKSEDLLADVRVFMSSDKVKTFEGARSENDNQEHYTAYALSNQVWIQWKDGTSAKVYVPMFGYDFNTALKLVPKGMHWAAGNEPENEKPFWFALGEESSVHHKLLPLACIEACVRHKIANPGNV